MPGSGNTSGNESVRRVCSFGHIAIDFDAWTGFGGDSEVTSIENLKIWSSSFHGKQVEYAILFDRDHPKGMGKEERPRKAAAKKAMVAFVCYSLGKTWPTAGHLYKVR